MWMKYYFQLIKRVMYKQMAEVDWSPTKNLKKAAGVHHPIPPWQVLPRPERKTSSSVDSTHDIRQNIQYKHCVYLVFYSLLRSYSPYERINVRIETLLSSPQWLSDDSDVVLF